ncbi:MAG: putative lipid II flippase FtsW [Ilumatobacteraceae bacterium]|nr:putative lipid II flippase FtsW [Ilumatobacteraceae bacterium]
MTTALTVSDRRRATLERINRGHVSDRQTDSDRPSVRSYGRRPASTRRAAGTETRRAPEVLGAPPVTYYAIAGVVAIFVMLGLVMVLSASAITEANLGNSPYRVFGRQAVWAGLGLISLLIAARVPYGIWRKFVLPLGLLGVMAMAAPFLPGVGATVNGARSWVRIGGLSIQPSEFLKLAVVVLAADLLARRGPETVNRQATVVWVGVLAAVGAGLCLAQGDLGSAVVLGAIVFSVAWIAGVPMIPLAMMSAAAASMALLFIASSPRRLNRFTAFTNVTEEKDHLAYQTYQGFLSMANGGLSGSGIGGSKGKLGYLPYAHSDFIFAIIADELGFIGTVAVIGGFILLVWFGIQTALAAPDRFGMLLAGGIACWFAVQAIVNLGGVTGLLPVTGLTLPFFSAGGSSLFVSMTAAGLLLSVARRLNAPATTAPASRVERPPRRLRRSR